MARFACVDAVVGHALVVSYANVSYKTRERDGRVVRDGRYERGTRNEPAPTGATVETPPAVHPWCFDGRARTPVVKQTAILHIAATGMVGAGVIVSDASLTVGLLLVGAALFVAGIVLARRDDGGSDADLVD